MYPTYLKSVVLLSLSICFSGLAVAEPITYEIDSSHTYPSFEADHFGGLSIWRGKVNSTSGSIVMDRAARTGTVDIRMEMGSIDFGHEGMNAEAIGHILDVENIPTATYEGRLVNFENGSPTAVEGMLTLHGVSLPVNLNINRFKCQPHYRTGAETCGADASATIDRSDFGLDADLDRGFFPEVRLMISVEARAPQED